MFGKVLLLGLVGYCLAQQQCCIPKQWEGMQRQTASTIKNGKPTVSETEIKVHLDLGNNRAAYDEKVTANKYTVLVKVIMDYAQQEWDCPFKVIMDYNQGIEYIISNNHCSKKVIPKTPQTSCVPKNAKFEGKHTEGTGKNKVEYNSFILNMNNVTARVSMTTTDCAPLNQIIYGTTGGVQYFVSDTFYDITPGIKDPTVFNVPSICDNAQFIKVPSSTKPTGILGR